MMKQKDTHTHSHIRWGLVASSVAAYVVMGALVSNIPNPMFPDAILALNMIVIVIAGYFGGPHTGALVGLLGTLCNFLIKIPLIGFDPYEAAAILPHTCMGFVAGRVGETRSRIGTALTVLVGHGLNLLFFVPLGLLPVSMLFSAILWTGLLAEVAVGLILTALIIGIVQYLPYLRGGRQLRIPERRKFILVASLIAAFTVILGLAFLGGITLAAYLFVLPVMLAAVALGFLEAWLTGVLLSILLGRAALELGLDAATQEVSLLLMLNLIALALGELAETLHQQRQLAQARMEELREAYQALAQADHLKSEMIQNISHEFRTPLSMILGYNELLFTGTLGSIGAQQEKALKVMHRQGWQLAYLVEQITVLHQVEQGNLSWQPVSLETLARDRVERFQERVDPTKWPLHFEVEGDLPVLEADSECLSRALNALLDNAIKFSPDGGRVNVRLWPNQDKVFLTVEDQGIGIPKDKHTLIFNRFYQVDGSMTRRFGGLGTGLAVVREVVHAHGGDVWVTSSEGEGSTFGFWLPLQHTHDSRGIPIELPPVAQPAFADQGRS